MANLIELKATYTRQSFRFENEAADVIVGAIDLVDGVSEELAAKVDELGDKFGGYSIKGPLDSDELQANHTYLFYGKWTTYSRKRDGLTELQFAFQTYVETQPYSRAGVIAYLKKCPGIGVGIASSIWQKYQSQAVRMLREQPEVVACGVARLAEETAREASVYLTAIKDIEDCTIGLMGLLEGRGFPRATAKRAMELWGNRAKSIIEHDPYRLMAFRGCGFKKCDSMYLELGHNPAKLKRQALCAWYYIARNGTGDTWVSAESIVREIEANVGATEANPVKALMLAKRAKIIAVKRTAGPFGELTEEKQGSFVWLAEFKKARQEEDICRYLVEADSETLELQWPEANELPAISDHQKDGLDSALTGRICYLIGGPGTGKTYTAAAVIRRLVEIHGATSIAACAPTGKAANRLSEAMADYRIPLRATTIHSLLGIGQSEDGFQHGSGCPLPFDFIVVDEPSMIATDLMRSLLAARKYGCHMLFLGDVNQLPPVGHGAPLRDRVALGSNVGVLTEIRRNSGAIVRACKDMVERRSFDICPQADFAENNLKLIHATTPELQIEKMLAGIEVMRVNGFDPVWDVQILAAVNKKSPLSRKTLNEILQRTLNRNPEIPNSAFRVGDKVVNTKNGNYTLVDQEESGGTGDDPPTIRVANGELAEIVSVEPKFFLARLPLGQKIRIPRGKAEDSESASEDDDRPATGTNWDLGYALSVHKSQGSEWPVVLVMLDTYPGAMRIASREWIYTAISRAKVFCGLIGEKRTADKMASRPAIHKRKTFLKELLESELVPF